MKTTLKKDSNQNKTYRIFDLYYPALMTFIVFTIAENLMQNVLANCSLENVLLIVLCVFIAIHLTGSYLRIDDWSQDWYPISALISDCLDIMIAIYICSAIVRYSRSADDISYLHLSIPLLIVSINQFWWFVFMRKFDKPALLRISVLFIGMVCVTCVEVYEHSVCNLVTIVVVIAILACLMIWDKSPKWFDKLAIHLRKTISGRFHYVNNHVRNNN